MKPESQLAGNHADNSAGSFQGETLCTKCGAHFHPETAFCGFDGTELVPCDLSDRDSPSAARSPLSAMECIKCGHKFPAYAKFCGVDGSALKPWLDPGPARATSAQDATPLNTQAAPLATPANTSPGTSATQAESSQAGSSQTDSSTTTKALGNLKEVSDWVNQTSGRKTGAVNLTRHEINFTEERPRRLIQEDSVEIDSSPASELALVGKTLEGKYLIQSVLAEGGMAVLYLARHTTMERTVVVKVVHGALNSSKNALQRFEREAKVLARLNHPNIVAVYDFGFINKKQPFLIMEFIKGSNLADKVEQHGPPTVPVACQIIMQICRGLEEAHATGIIHRDLKPDNIILQERSDRPDWVKIVDFGIAHLLDSADKRLTRAGRITGTPEYMSPEQFKDKPLDTRADIYSLGVVIFEMITGRLPFEAEDLGVLMAKQLMETAPSVSTLREDIIEGSPIDLLIKKCLEKDPELRYPTAADLRRAAETIALSYRQEG